MSKAEEIDSIDSKVIPALQNEPNEPNESRKKSMLEKFLNILVIARNSPFVYLSNHPKQANIVLSCTIFILYNIYFVFALTHRADENLEWEFCDGHGFLVIVTAITYVGLFYYLIFIPCFGEKLYQLFKPLGKFWQVLSSNQIHVHNISTMSYLFI